VSQSHDPNIGRDIRKDEGNAGSEPVGSPYAASLENSHASTRPIAVSRVANVVAAFVTHFSAFPVSSFQPAVRGDVTTESETASIAYAHSKEGAPKSDWHTLKDHLQAVARLASGFASKWDAGDWGHYAGLWHDLGKYALDWQEFLRMAGEDASVLSDDASGSREGRRKRGPDHSTAGAIHAGRAFANSRIAMLLQFVIASHHAGLPNRDDLDLRVISPEKLSRYEAARVVSDPIILAARDALAFPSFLVGGTQVQQKRSYEFLTRMIFSSLVDADFLDTEEFMEHERVRSSHRTDWPDLVDYLAPLDRHLAGLGSAGRSSATVRVARSRVLQWCRDFASEPRGTFSLTVPTGGGKTLASLAFALAHAEQQHLDRVIIVLPFLSIIDQTVKVLRDIYEPLFGDRVLIEHHSSVSPERDTARNRLASENWDAPLVVTTQVQFFESLFARRPGDCRKLHNIAHSVVILDEVQTLPIGLMNPMLDALQELSANYGSTLLLTTATQPSLHARPLGAEPFAGLDPAPREIVPAAELEGLFESLRRVDVIWPTPSSPGERRTPADWPTLAGRIATLPQVLAIVHKRDDARELWREVETKVAGALHLSALMCPAHRREVLAQVRALLEAEQPCRVISTQLVEAGVDVDFPVVFRAMAGLESLAQSAGRCNRNGRWQAGRFEVFDAPTLPPRSLDAHRRTAEVMLNSSRGEGHELDLFSPATFRAYFDRLYAHEDRDAPRVQQSREMLTFETTFERFRMIPDKTTTIFVPYGAAGAKVVHDCRHSPINRETLRHLQPFGVSVYDMDMKALRSRGAIELLHDAVWVLVAGEDYHERFGLNVEGEAYAARFA
jgi:CRISPR-associated endonuclease/helicase Cas3